MQFATLHVAVGPVPLGYPPNGGLGVCMPALSISSVAILFSVGSSHSVSKSKKYGQTSRIGRLYNDLDICMYVCMYVYSIILLLLLLLLLLCSFREMS